MVVIVVHDLPPDGWFVALVGITRTTHRRGESV
jgi:phenylpyruvate tautomerase PptA (4-oxalocrotonate tautomerase family)